MSEEIKIQLLKGDRLIYVNLNDFITFISSKGKIDSLFNKTPLEQNDNKFMKINELCSILSISKPTVNSWCEKGVLKKIKLQGRVYYNREEVMKLLENN